jgi:putative membrane protein
MGFLPYKATFMLDVAVLAVFLVLPILIYGLYQAHKKNYFWHAKVMTTLGIIVFVVVVAFEIDIRLQGGIKQILEKAERSLAFTPAFEKLLYIHIFFAISTCIVWVMTTFGAIKHFGLKNPMPGPYSKKHKLLGKLSTFGVLGVAVTGVMVYYMGFIKSLE